MLLALVLINTDTGFESEVLEVLKKIEESTEAYITYGPYNIVAKIKAETMGKLEEIVKHIRKLERVRETVPLIVYGR